MSDPFRLIALHRFNASSFEELRERGDLFKFVSDKDLEDVAVQFAYELEKNGDPCQNNYRIFPSEMIDDFNNKTAEGCCGSMNLKYKAPSGQEYLLGFNYGH